MVQIVIAGIGGRMGREIFAASQADPDVEVVGGTARATAAQALQSSFGDSVPIVSELRELGLPFDVLVDFTNPELTLHNAAWCADHVVRLVAGTTGLSAEQLSTLLELSSRTAIFHARNMSVGLNAVLGLLPSLVRSLDGYDIEIVEAHHRHKSDAPSGTALALAEVIASAMDRPLEEMAHYGRHGSSLRTSGEIGIHSVRGGGNAGEHTVLFASEGEEIQLVHRAFSRRTFALGAVRAAKFMDDQPPGFYTMTNLLGRSI